MKINLSSILILVLCFSCMQPVPRKPITSASSSVLDESVSYNKALNKKQEDYFKQFIAKDSIAQYIESANGFWYTYIKKSSSTYAPQFGDQVVYDIAVFDIEKNIIYSKEELGEQSYYIDQQDLVDGLRNGLKLMHEGDVVTFLFPSHKVFGYLGDEKKIGANQSLIYKVELIKINIKNESN